MKKQRIRIHKKMLEELNRPEYIVILVNPYKSTIAVVPMETSDKDTLKVSYDDSECEYYSKKLMSQLPVGPLDGVGVDGQAPRQLPHAGELLPRLQDAGRDVPAE